VSGFKRRAEWREDQEELGRNVLSFAINSAVAL
jgi:hypothetical protein